MSMAQSARYVLTSQKRYKRAKDCSLASKLFPLSGAQPPLARLSTYCIATINITPMRILLILSLKQLFPDSNLHQL